MFDANEYQLIDFGEGRRLERFGGRVLDRACPAAEGIAKADSRAWSQAVDRFERTGPNTGRWTASADTPPMWIVAHGALRFELKQTEFGHLGLFPEQAANWDWLDARVREAIDTAQQGVSLRVLNLFAYTGGSTLIAAAAGAEVTHVDAARNVIAWARRNAELSGLAAAPIRWIVDDARKFVRREVRRGARYDAVVLDPPSYGHGERGEVWRLSRDLPELLAGCAELLGPEGRFLLLTCHTPEFDAPRLTALVQGVPGWANLMEGGRVDAGPLELTSRTGRTLPSGVVVRAHRGQSEARS